MNFRVFFSCEMANFELYIYCVSVFKDARILLKVSKCEIYLEYSLAGTDEYLIFMFLLIKTCGGCLVFHLPVLLQKKHIFPAFSCVLRRFYCHYYFHYVYF